MDYKEHDHIAKVVIGVLVEGRELVPEAELRLPAFGDILIRPGPPLSPALGLLASLLGTGLALLEFFSARPSSSALHGVQAKAWVSLWLELRKQKRFAGVTDTRIVVVANGLARTAMRRLVAGAPWASLSPGLWLSRGHPPTHYLDLLRLPVTPETAWLHVAGNSIWVEEALVLLTGRHDAVTKTFLARVSEEMPHMELQTDSESVRETRRFLKAWEAAAAISQGLSEGRSQGLSEGRSQGLVQGFHRILRIQLTQRFGLEAEAVVEKLLQISDPAVLEPLMLRVLTCSRPEELLPEQHS